MPFPPPEAPGPVELTGPPLSLVLTRPLTTARQYLRALGRVPFRAQGQLKGDVGRPVEVRQDAVEVPANRVADFREVCGFPREGPVPACFVETLFLGPMAAIALAPAFPLSPMGLIHLRQEMALLRPVSPGTRLDLRCTLAALRATDRGFEVDCAMEARDSDGVTWTGKATLLSRSLAARQGKTRTAVAEDRGGAEEWSEPVCFSVPADQGRRYARVSTDYNLHHLYPWTARLFGYPQPIAQGMWTLARALSSLEAHFSPATVVEAAFKRPLFMPGDIAVRWRAEGASVAFEAFHPEKGVPFVQGRVVA